MDDKLDLIDLRLLTELQRDGRMSLTDLSEKVGLSIAPCQRRVKRLEERGLIIGYRALVDRKRLGCGMTIFVGVKVERHGEAEEAAFMQAVAAMKEVVACHLVSGDSDFLLEVAVPDMEAYEAMVIRRLIALPSVTGIRSAFVLRTYKRDGVLPVKA